MKESHRLILAVVLSGLVFLGWNAIYGPPKMDAPSPDPAKTEAPAAKPATSEAAPGVPAPAGSGVAQPVAEGLFDPAQGKRITIKTPLYEAVLNSQGGVLEHFFLNNYMETITSGSPRVDLIGGGASAKAPLALLVQGQAAWRGGWKVEGDAADRTLTQGQTTVTLVGEAGGLAVRRALTFSADSYLITEKVTLASPAPARARIGFSLAARPMSAEGDSYNQTRVAWLSKGSLSENHDLKELRQGVQQTEAIGWGALQSNYFLAGVIPAAEGGIFKAKLEDNVYRLVLEKDGVTVEPGAPSELAVSYFLGPKKPAALEGAPGKLSLAVDLGIFGFIARPIITFLDLLNGYVHNYGVAIIILTALIKLALWPLAQKSYKSMEQMKKLQPMMEKIREKHADDREKMNAEMMALYKTYKVNPAGGCLPMLMQLPIFFGLYTGLMNAVELRHAPFIKTLPFTDIVWLADLSAKDPFYVTPLIMGATMFLQQRMTPPPGDPTQAKVMMFMPLIFTFMFLNFPAGLVVYWLVNNVLSILQQWLQLRSSK